MYRASAHFLFPTFSHPLPTPCAGLWSNATAATSLEAGQQCPLGTFNPNRATGATSGTCYNMTCSAGAFFIPLASSSVNCGYCPRGTYSTTVDAYSNATCLPCEPGYSSAPGSSACVACEAGSFAAVAGSPFCTLCNETSYSNITAATACAPCPPETLTPEPGALSVDSCAFSSIIGCPPGYKPGSGTSCVECPLGSYNAVDGALSCTSCGIGFYSNVTGATNSSSCRPLECFPGTYWVLPVR